MKNKTYTRIILAVSILSFAVVRSASGGWSDVIKVQTNGNSIDISPKLPRLPKNFPQVGISIGGAAPQSVPPPITESEEASHTPPPKPSSNWNSAGNKSQNSSQQTTPSGVGPKIQFAVLPDGTLVLDHDCADPKRRRNPGMWMPRYQEKLFGAGTTNNSLAWQILRIAFTQNQTITDLFELAEDYSTKNEFQKRELVEKVLPLYKEELAKAGSISRVRFVSFLIPSGEYDLAKGEQSLWNTFQPPGINLNSGKIPTALKIPEDKVRKCRETPNLNFACATIYSGRFANLGFKTGHLELDIETAETHLILVDSQTGRIHEDSILQTLTNPLPALNPSVTHPETKNTPESLEKEIGSLLDDIVTKVKSGEFPKNDIGDSRQPDFPALKNWFSDRVFVSPDDQLQFFRAAGASDSEYDYLGFVRNATRCRDNAIAKRQAWWQAARTMDRDIIVEERTEDLRKHYHYSMQLQRQGNEPVWLDLGSCIAAKSRVYQVFVAEKATRNGDYLALYWVKLDGQWKCIPDCGPLRTIKSAPKTRF